MPTNDIHHPAPDDNRVWRPLNHCRAAGCSIRRLLDYSYIYSRALGLGYLANLVILQLIRQNLFLCTSGLVILQSRDVPVIDIPVVVPDRERESSCVNPCPPPGSFKRPPHKVHHGQISAAGPHDGSVYRMKLHSFTDA